MMCSCIRFAIGIAISLLFVQESISQSPPLSPEKLGYSAFSLERPELGQVNYYVRNIEKNPTQPIIIYLDGSGPYPLFQRMEQGFGSTLVVQDRQLLDKFKLGSLVSLVSHSLTTLNSMKKPAFLYTMLLMNTPNAYHSHGAFNQQKPSSTSCSNDIR